MGWRPTPRVAVYLLKSKVAVYRGQVCEATVYSQLIVMCKQREVT